MFSTVIFQSFRNWFQTFLYWNPTQKVKKNQSKLVYWVFFFKKQLFVNLNSTYISFLINFLFNFKLINSLSSLVSLGFLGLKSIWLHLRFWVLPLFLALVVALNFIFIKALPFNKVVFLWIAFFMIYYWLISGFVFFVKKYQYGKFTSAIQRFWKRSYILFWLLESCLLLVFVYLTFTASQESFYMFDQIQIYKTHLFSWRLFLSKNIPIVVLIALGYFLLLTLKWNTFNKHSVWLLIITFLLTYVIWIEFYQFYHIVNFYGNLNWVYDFDEKVWNLELEARRTRIVNNYVMLLLILRFWHLIFVYIFWLFFVLRGCEIKRLRYPLLAANFQNLIILYIMNWLTMYPWFKITFRKYLNQPYTVFNVNNRILFNRVFFNDVKLYLLNFFEFDFTFFKNYFNKDFFYFIEWNQSLYAQHSRKHFIKNNIITELKSTEFNTSSQSIQLVSKNWVSFFSFIETSLSYLNFNLVLDFLYLPVTIFNSIFYFVKKVIEYILYIFNSFLTFLV